MKRLIPILALYVAAPLAAQTIPRLGQDNPRLQTIAYSPGDRVLLTAMPQAALTVMLEPGEQIERAILGGGTGFEVKISAEGDSFSLFPQSAVATGSLDVETDRRHYSFVLQTGTGLTAAYLVQFRYGGAGNAAYRVDNAIKPAAAPAPGGQIWAYRLKGDSAVRPASISDDGARTFVGFAPDQAMPAVFAIGPAGDEQVVNGFMRGDLYVIDQVYEQLVFRIDKKRAVASRNRAPEGGQ
ncbi:MAG: TrbG/VirB9 family P-type conjugative transfer protein [Sphingomonadales bacterium]|nr:TrbG/VirB9 family P-type conjugative transfer protein [Sphingomonadales bacterium]MBD3775096.1 TrbG/VirB9 family P-type conjugative transfer protein [Paracoccaceae bacterium]